MFLIRQAENEAEVILAARLYMSQNDNSFLKLEKVYCEEQAVKYWKQLNYFRVIVKDDSLVGLIAASKKINMLSNELSFCQDFYATNLKGVSAGKAVVAAHKDLLEYAIKMKAKYVMSSGSHMDDNNVFARLLEKSGWQRRNFLCIYRF